MFEALKETSNQSSIMKKKFFCLSSIVINNPSEGRELTFQSIIPKFKMNAISFEITWLLHRLSVGLSSEPANVCKCDGI